MQRINIIILLLIVSGRLMPLCAQFPWHLDGQTGYEAAVQTILQNGAVGVGAVGGYSLWGVLDMNISAAQYFLSGKISDQSVSASQFQPSLTLIGFGGSPLTIVAHAAYTIERYHSSAFTTQPNTADANYFSFSSGFEVKAHLSPSVMIEPTFGLEYTAGTTDLEGSYIPTTGYQSPLSSPMARTPFVFAFPMFFQNSSQRILTIIPGFRYFPVVATGQDDLEFRLTAGFFFRTSSEEE
jgi:hypothetical protein